MCRDTLGSSFSISDSVSSVSGGVSNSTAEREGDIDELLPGHCTNKVSTIKSHLKNRINTHAKFLDVFFLPYDVTTT